MSAQVHVKLARSLPRQRARVKAIKTHGRRAGIAALLVLVAVMVTSFLPSGVRATPRGPESAQPYRLISRPAPAPGSAAPANMTAPQLPGKRRGGQ
jgi:hypothetical protein